MAWRGPTTASSNPVPNSVNLPPSVSDVLATENRAKNVKRNDKVKNFSVNLTDIDTTIIRYLNEKISPEVVTNGQVVKVPVNYASPEKWKSIKKDGYMRDKNGKIQCPAIALRRTTMQRNDQLITLNRYLSYPSTKLYSEKNQYDKFSQMNDFAPVREIFNVTAPDHVILNYDFIVWTDYVEQMNPVIEAINFSTEDYWGDKARYKFRTSISDYNFQTETPADGDRVVKTTFTMIVYAYLLPETFENHKQTVEKAFTPRKIIFDAEVVSDVGTASDSRKRSALNFPRSGSSVPIPQLFSRPAPTTSTPTDHVLWADRSGNSDSATSAISASYAITASYALSNAGTASSAVNAQTASYLLYTVGVPTTFSSINIVGGGTTGSITTSLVSGVSTPTAVDSIPVSSGNASKWLVSISDGTNFQASDVIGNWSNSGVVDFAEVSSNPIGTVPVFLSVIYNSGFIYLVATPASGTWTVKVLRTLI